MSLPAGHRGRRVVEHYDHDIMMVVGGVDYTRDAAREKRRVADEREVDRIGLDAVQPLRNRDASTHAEAGIDHLERRGVAERIAADVTGEDRLAPFHRLLHSEERRAVRAAGAEHRGPSGRFGGGLAAGNFGCRNAQQVCDRAGNERHGVLASVGQVARPLAEDRGG